MFIAVIFGNDPTLAKPSPLDEMVERFVLVESGGNRDPQILIGQILQQEGGSDRASQFSESLIQTILPAIGAQATQDGRGRNTTGPDGEDDP